MTTLPSASARPIDGTDARDLQTRLYREIGISAVAAALRCIKQPEPGKAAVIQHPTPAVLRSDDLAA